MPALVCLSTVRPMLQVYTDKSDPLQCTSRSASTGKNGRIRHQIDRGPRYREDAGTVRAFLEDMQADEGLVAARKSKAHIDSISPRDMCHLQPGMGR